MNLPEINNNPLSLLVADPTRGFYKGVIGREKNGFLKFDTLQNGVRAGIYNLIALVNGGFNTIDKIFNIYGDPGAAARETYKRHVEKKTGYNRFTPIVSNEQIYNIGKAVVSMENFSFWVHENIYNAGFNDAIKANQLIKVIKTAGISLGAVVLLLVAFIFIFNK